MIGFLKEEWFTILSIIISGAISWAISAIYFRKGNRDALQSSVIFPVLTILSDSISKENYLEIKALSQNPLIRFFNKDERQKFLSIVKEYRFVYSYNEDLANATAIVSDVEYRLKNMGINPRCVPIELDDGSFEYIYPEEINHLHADIQKVFERYCWQTETKECTYQILALVKRFVKAVYTSNIIDLCKDYDIKSIIENAEITSKWHGKFEKFNTAKKEFESLEIVKNSKKLLEE